MTDDSHSVAPETGRKLAFDQSICPKCGGITVADFVDIGVGMQQSGPFGCEWCGWYEENTNNLFEISDEDLA